MRLLLCDFISSSHLQGHRWRKASLVCRFHEEERDPASLNQQCQIDWRVGLEAGTSLGSRPPQAPEI